MFMTRNIYIKTFGENYYPMQFSKIYLSYEDYINEQNKTTSLKNEKKN